MPVVCCGQRLRVANWMVVCQEDVRPTYGEKKRSLFGPHSASSSLNLFLKQPRTTMCEITCKPGDQRRGEVPRIFFLQGGQYIEK